MTDRALYDELQARMWQILRDKKDLALDQPEYKALWGLSEAIKNKHGGMPPKKESTP